MSQVLPCVVKLRREGEKLIQDCDVYIGNSWSRNGWNLSGSKWSPGMGTDLVDISELDGKVLGCWCDSLENCHGKIFIQMFKEKYPDCKENPDLWKTQYFPDGKPKKTKAKKRKGETLKRPEKKKMRKSIRNQETNPDGIKYSGAIHPWPTVPLDYPEGTIYIDEAGMGCFAGPLHVAGVILLKGFNILGLHDSKLLKDHEREAAYKALLASDKLIYHIEKMPNDEIDRLKLGGAWKQAIRNVISTLNQKMSCSQVILDGNKTVDNTEVPITPVIKADRLITGVSAASILAKVSRDDYMKNIADQYPLEFRDIFIKGKGYRYNKSHDELIKKGIYTNLHRKSYNPLRTVLAEKEKVVIHHTTDSINPLHQLASDQQFSDIVITPQDPELESN